MLTSPAPRAACIWAAVMTAACVALCLYFFRTEAAALWKIWSQEEYSHAFIVAPLSLYWIVASIRQEQPKGPAENRVGTATIAAGLLTNIVGALIASTWLTHIAIIIVIAGAILVTVGKKALTTAWKGLFLLALVIPLPPQFMTLMTAQLQLVSSALGELILQTVQIPVFREGNVIDLGTIQLQVAEACSGLNYLFPLLCFSLLAVFFFNLRNWVRIILVLSSLPIAILANALRIATIGVTAAVWGRQAAEGVLHVMEGFVFFSLCLLMLAACLWICLRLSGDRLSAAHPLKWHKTNTSLSRRLLLPPGSVLIIILLLLGAGIVKTSLLERRTAIETPYSVAEFPQTIGTWRGSPQPLSLDDLNALHLSNYFNADYASQGENTATNVNFYVAYYASTQLYNVPHSPLVCLPGSGWKVVKLESFSFLPNGAATTLVVNRVLITKSNLTLLVYYWWRVVGRDVASTFDVKGRLLLDTIRTGRSDVALVRAVISVTDQDKIGAQDKILQDFIADSKPHLDKLLPPPARAPSGGQP